MKSSSFCVMMGRVCVSNDSQAVLESFVGSSIALCLYDPQAKVAGMAHVIYPDGERGKTASENPAKYANLAIQNAMSNMAAIGAQTERIVAKMAGGAEIFSHQEKQGMFNIGERNVMALKKLLKENGIQLVSEDTGMNYGRHVRFNVKSGEVTVIATKGDGERVI